eukprot:gnl/TRDRNA2_/TRDRNA2_53932_c0_seq2.p1 gnl/TRDRNA2_/TRDRNA2_53932_c0~~gnl/TRDRNA2_/TRDRNA2_53932_c0_seq2.p1  ORF type:complete len:304 (+),score=23.80 gnl/TRDRNA2_/TRDRNA2_53932_c0_seq2:25-912(+)
MCWQARRAPVRCVRCVGLVFLTSCVHAYIESGCPEESSGSGCCMDQDADWCKNNYAESTWCLAGACDNEDCCVYQDTTQDGCPLASPGPGLAAPGPGCCLGKAADWCERNYHPNTWCQNNACGEDDCCVHSPMLPVFIFVQLGITLFIWLAIGVGNVVGFCYAHRKRQEVLEKARSGEPVSPPSNGCVLCCCGPCVVYYWEGCSANLVITCCIWPYFAMCCWNKSPYPMEGGVMVCPPSVAGMQPSIVGQYVQPVGQPMGQPVVGQLVVGQPVGATAPSAMAVGAQNINEASKWS